uniref:RNI-like protein n=1 Tax=Plectus sambesii TaxID=2011161 RepID=A0A914V356_9BILA
MVQCPLVKLSLEGHYFSTPLILPPTLEKLKLSVCGDESTEFFDNLRQLPHLRRLYITDNGDTYSKHSRKSLLSFSDKLHGLSITLFDVAHDSKFIYRLATNCSNLTTLDITDCLMRKEFGGGRLIDDLLSRPDGTDLMPLFSSPQKAAQLKHLRLSLATISRQVLETIADNCVGLRTLDLANCPSLTDELLERIAFNSGQTLKVVDIARCSEITNQGIVGVALYCPNLEEIMMFQCAVSDEALYALGSNCLHLRVCGIHPGAASREAIDYVKRSTDGRLFV